MNKKIKLLVLLLIVIILVLIVVGIKKYKIFDKTILKDDEEETFTEEELEDMDYVDNKISQLIKSEDYKKLTLDEKIIKVEKVLNELKKDGYIIYYNHEKESNIFNFKYKCGVAGAVMLEDFEPGVKLN